MNSLDVLPNAGINSSTIHAAFSKENKRSWKSFWASSVQKTTQKRYRKGWGRKIFVVKSVGNIDILQEQHCWGIFCAPFLFWESCVLGQKEMPFWGENIGSRKWVLFILRIPNPASANKLEKKKRNEEAGICVRHAVNDTLLIKLIPSLNNSGSHKSLSPLNRKAWMN